MGAIIVTVDQSTPQWIQDLVKENYRLKKLNQNLKVNLARYKQKCLYLNAAMSLVPQNVWWVDEAGNFVFVNAEMTSLFDNEMTAQQLQNRNAYDFFRRAMPEHEVEKIIENDRYVNKSGGTVVFEENFTINGITRTFLSYKKSIYNYLDRKRGVIGVGIDITDRKLAEDALKDAMDHVEHVNDEKNQFLQNIRHDIRTPISNILGAAEVMQQMDSDPTQAEFLDAIVSSGNHLMGLFAQLLDFSKMSTEETPINLEDIDIAELLKEVQSNTYMAAHKKKLSFELDVATDIPGKVALDRMRLFRILTNLLNNAVKYTDEGSVKLAVGSLCDGKQIYFDVIDTGVGIAKKDFKKIFEPLTRLVNSHTGRYDGLGLGLSIVDRFVRELHGRIHLHSQKDKGSEFRVIVPCDWKQAEEEIKTSLDRQNADLETAPID